jgi:hypothetical protein
MRGGREGGIASTTCGGIEAPAVTHLLITSVGVGG